jgi:hypothetical protein
MKLQLPFGGTPRVKRGAGEGVVLDVVVSIVTIVKTMLIKLGYNALSHQRKLSLYLGSLLSQHIALHRCTMYKQIWQVEG